MNHAAITAIGPAIGNPYHAARSAYRHRVNSDMATYIGKSSEGRDVWVDHKGLFVEPLVDDY